MHTSERARLPVCLVVQPDYLVILGHVSWSPHLPLHFLFQDLLLTHYTISFERNCSNRLSKLASVCMCWCKKKHISYVEQPVLQKRNKSRNANMAAYKRIPFWNQCCPHVSQRVSSSVTGPLSIFSGTTRLFFLTEKHLLPMTQGFIFFPADSGTFE